MSDSSNKTNNKSIILHSFYFIHDKSKSGHPGLIIKKDDLNNRYLVIRFDSDKPGATPKFKRGVKHIVLLNKPIDNRVINSYARSRPMICKRKDIGKHLADLTLDPKDIDTINKISKRNPEFSPSLSKKKTPR